jgi:ubiquinone/menaquinone biosynthesis C-methylase UbiE
MKKYIVSVLCIFTSLNCMEEQPLIEHKPEKKAREWDAQAYDNSNTIHTNIFLSLLSKNKVITKDRTILDIGCGTGNIAARLAKKATHIDAFDASNNMIDYAETKYYDIPNLYFERHFAEDFITPKKYQLALASFSMHWFKDQKKTLHNISTCLKKDGEFFATVSTSNNPKSSNLLAAEAVLSKYLWFLPFNIDLTECNFPSIEELQTMFDEAGFKIITIKEECLSGTTSKNELREGLWAIVSGSPILQWISSKLVTSFFDWYVDECMPYLPKTDDGKLLYTMYTTTVHARKK